VSYVCPNGHDSTAPDFCDTCGAPIDQGANGVPGGGAGAAAGAGGAGGAGASGSGASPAAPAAQTCPHCQSGNAPGALFCEACGYDFTTGALPRPVPPPPNPFLPPPSPGGNAGSGSALDLDGPVSAEVEPAADPAGGPEGEPAGAAASDPAPSGTATGDPESASSSDPGAPSSPVEGEGEANESAPAAAAVTPPPASSALEGGASGIPPAIALEWVAEIWIDPDWYAGQEAEEPMPSPGLPVVVPLTVRSALIGRVSTSKNIRPDIDCTTDSGVSRRHAQLTTDGKRWFVEDLGSSNGTYVGGTGEALPEDPIAVGPKKELDPDDRIYVGAWTRIVVRPATDEEKSAATSA